MKIVLGAYLGTPQIKKCVSPKDVLAGTASLLIQKDTQDRTTISVQGMYVWMVKYPILLLRSK
jgi:hypothetical protein